MQVRRCIQMVRYGVSFLVFPAQAGIHFRHGHRPEFILGPRTGRTRAGVTGYLRSAFVWRHPVNPMKASEH